MPEPLWTAPATEAADAGGGDPGPAGWRRRVDQLRRELLRGGRRVCGIPDYEGYVAHLRRHHPDAPVMTFEEFFRQRLDARYGGRGGGSRCC